MNFLADSTTPLAQTLEILMPVLALLATWATAETARFVRRRVKNDTVQGMLIRLNDAVAVAVGEVGQTVVPELKRAAADGRLTEAEAVMLRGMAVDRVKKILSERGVSEAQKVLQIEDFEDWITARIEAAVADKK